jgi:hypothetical protein
VPVVNVGEGESHGAVVAQAQGMICSQVACTPDEALLLMRARARHGDLSVTYIAAAVVGGSIRFD